MTGHSSRRLLPFVVAALGVALFIYAIRQAGVSAIADGVRRVGWGLFVVVALGGARFVIRAECWRLCLPPQATLSFPQALTAFVAGDAVGSVTPLGLLASEPTKVFLTRHHLVTRASVSSLALENLVYSASVIAMIGLGVTVLLLFSTVPEPLRTGLQLLLGGLAVFAVAAPILVRLPLLGFLRRRLPSRLVGLASLGEELMPLARLSSGRLFVVLALDLAYHAVAVLEVFVTLQWLMGSRAPTLAMAIVFETLNRVTTVAFKFVPFRVGIDEVLTGALAPLIAVDPASGVALAVVRKIRSLVWVGVGLVAIVAHPASAARPQDETPTP